MCPDKTVTYVRIVQERGSLPSVKKQPNVGLARSLRHNQTDAERMLWSKLRSVQMEGVIFRRQQTIENYIAEFVSFEKKVIIVVDGGQHAEMTAEKDKQRTAYLAGR